MDQNKMIKATLNFFAVTLLISLIAAPIYFAQNFAKVAGVKTQTAYIITSQIAKFPGAKLEQEQNSYQVSFTKQATSQAYLGILILTNPTNQAKSYSIIQASGANSAFFGEDINNLQAKVRIPPSTSVPVSLVSTSDQDSQTIQFSIIESQ